ncbi:Golgi-associated RAB2 interactor protein 5B [Rhinolophus ferrumequinum]|uniref:Golgi-associated RAB2 interactor protein 5B n=1 Tax=Rhinolophus ferrumequinum TaxID=59479 RepID=UPI00140FD07A|nr:Golgi-associated RAB2 interactor protein 5B [Rhinolophus ferrumequinum]
MNRLWNIRRPDPLPGPPKWVPTLGKLQKTLQKGEYLPLRPLPMFESNFVQVTNQGAPVYVHHKTNRLTMGVAASLPGLVLPDLLLIAQPPEGRDCSNLVLTRMIPLDLVHLYVHNLSAWRLKLRLITGRYYYLELDAPAGELAFLFDRWIRLINLLQEPATTWAPRTLHTPPTDLALMAPPASTWRLQDQSHTRRSDMTVDPTFPYKTLTSQKQKKAKTFKHRFKSQAVGDSLPLIWSQLEHADTRKKSTEKKSHPDRCLHSCQTKIQVPEKPSITIRTIFSIISSTINQMPSSSKDGTCESDRAVVLGGLIETPSQCISEDSHISLLGSFNHFDTYLSQQDMEDQIDSKSSTLSSSSPNQATCSSNFNLPASYSSIPRHNKKDRPLGSVQRLRPPPSQKTPSIPATSWKAPFILDQAQKVSAVCAPSQKDPAGPTAPQKTQIVASVPQKAPAIPGPSWKDLPVSVISHKTSAVPAPSQKAAAIPGPSQKTPRVLAIPQKAPAIPAPSQKAPSALAIPPKAVSTPTSNHKFLFLPTPYQKAPTSPTQYQMTLDPADFGMLSMGSHGGNVLEKSQLEGKPESVGLMGTQEKKVREMRAQKMSLEFPFTTTREVKEVAISKAREITLDGLKGKSKLEDNVQRMKEEKSGDWPGFKSKEVGQQKKWVETQELAMEGAQQEHSRPFSVEGLTFAKLMIMANSKQPPLRPELVSLPPWFLTPLGSATSRMGAEPLRPSQVLEGSPVVVREQPWLGPWAKGSTSLWVEETSHPWAEVEVEELPSDQRGPSKVPPHYQCVPSSPKMDRASQAPIPLPATRWEDVIQSPILLTPISKMEARVSQKPKRESQESVGMLGQRPLAMTGSSLEILKPKLLEIESMRDMANKVEKTKKELGVFMPSRRYLGRQDLWSYQQ